VRTLVEGTSPEAPPRRRTKPDYYPIAAGTVLAAGLWLWFAQFQGIHPPTPAGMEGAVRDQCFAVVLILGGIALWFRVGGVVVAGICALAGIGLALAALFLGDETGFPVVNAVVTGAIAALGALAAPVTRTRS
jgi:hypothetical protein